MNVNILIERFIRTISTKTTNKGNKCVLFGRNDYHKSKKKTFIVFFCPKEKNYIKVCCVFETGNKGVGK